MKISLKRLRTWTGLGLAALLAVQTLAVIPSSAGAAAAEECLTMSGAGNVPLKDVDIDQEFEIEYTLTPGGNYSVTEQRAPVDISLVLDVSGSMLYGLNGATNAKAPNRRVDALKTATATLIQKFKESNLDNVGLVQFSTKASRVSLNNANSQGLTKNYTDLQSKINGLSYNGATNIDDALRKAKDMLAGSPRPKYVILLTDGAANRYGTNGNTAPNSSQDPTSRGRSEALLRANELKAQNITAYTIGLMTPEAIANMNNPNFTSKGEMDVYLMNQIASRTDGKFYAASDSSSLAEVFNSIVNVIANTSIRNVSIKQPIPPGFVLADSELSNPNVKSEDGYLVLSFDDIPYPFQKGAYTKKVKLKATSKVNGESHPLSDATVSYVNACSSSKSFTIHLDSTIRILGVATTDIYGNTYYGNYRGELTRKRADNGSLQWTYHDPLKRRITAIDFVKPDGSPDTGGGRQDTRVKLTFAEGEPAVLDLRPSAPVIQVSDRNGKEPGGGDWVTGTIQLKVAGASESGLQGENGRVVYTETGKADFQEAFIRGYEYSLDQGMNWITLPYIAGEYTLSLSAEGKHKAEVRAVNETISLQVSKPVYSEVAEASVQIDQTPPAADGDVTIVVSEEGYQEDARIRIMANDTLSPVTGMELWLDDGASPRKEIAGAAADFLLSSIPGYKEAASRYGWHQIKVTVHNEAGLSRTYNFGELVPDFKINPGPQAVIGLTDHQGGSYESSQWADKPVKVSVAIAYPVSAKYGNPAITAAGSRYAIISSSGDGVFSSPVWRELSSGSFYVTPSGGADSGVFKVGIQLADTDGVTREYWSDEVKIDFNQNRY